MTTDPTDSAPSAIPRGRTTTMDHHSSGAASVPRSLVLLLLDLSFWISKEGIFSASWGMHDSRPDDVM
eukprot:3200557-Rhodomonas_salina.2